MSLIIRAAFARRAEIRAEYEEVLWAAYQRAETACNGRLLNRRGAAAGIDPIRLFKSNTAFAYAYASEELIEHWRTHPRPTFAAYEAQRLRDADALAEEQPPACHERPVWCPVHGWQHAADAAGEEGAA